VVDLIDRELAMKSSTPMNDFAARAKTLYELHWREALERTNLHDYLAIEPDTEQYFLGKSLTEAMVTAHKACPDKQIFGLRVGHRAAVHLGGLW